MPSIPNQYTQYNLFDTILQALAQTGIAQQQVTRSQLAAVDEFHVRGLEVSREMAAMADLHAGGQVLDVGCGLGGATRLLADEFGCAVTGIDITPEYIHTAQQLSALVGLASKTHFVCGNALSLPFTENSFDVVWTQHVQMNIADKQTLYAEINRVLKETGHFVYYDIVKKNKEPIHYPVPWANEPALNHLIPSPQLHQLLVQTGLRPVQIKDETEKGITFLQHVIKGWQQKGMSPLGLHLLMGDSALQKLQNLYNNLVEARVMLECGLYSKPN